MTSLPDGFRYICLFDGKGGLSDLDIAKLDEWKPEDGVIWYHINFEEPAAIAWLEKQDLDPIAVEALSTVESRPRLSKIGNGALLAFRGVNLNEGAAPDDMIGIRLWVDETRIISSFRRDLFSVDDIYKSLQSGDGPQSSADFISALASRLVSRMSDTVDNLEELIGDLEDNVVTATDRQTRYTLANLRRQIIALRRYLAPQREAFSSLVSSKFNWIAESDRVELREASDRLIRNLEDLDAIRERAAVTQEELQSRIAEQQNIRMYVLSIVAAIFLPLGFLTGLLGINVGGIPGAENPKSFAIFSIFLVIIVALQIVFFRTRKWF